MTNNDIAQLLDDLADLLERQDANPYRIRAYRDGAQTVRSADDDIAQVVEAEGAKALEDLPNIGESLAGVIGEYVSTGESTLRQQLQSKTQPGDALERVPGIGEELAQRIHDVLGIETLAELEQAAHDGRLDGVEGFGEKRIEQVRTSLAGMLSQSTQRRSRQRTRDGQDREVDAAQPPVATLLDVDAEYRRRAADDDLQRIAPKRFNPDNESWLPILHTKRPSEESSNHGDWSFTALFSNTARAHDLDKTDDWVVLYYRREDWDADDERQNTVVTETRGSLEGKRVVRGREAECREYYG